MYNPPSYMTLMQQGNLGRQEMYQPEPPQRPQRRTALNDLDAFLAGLPTDERLAVVSSPDFQAEHGALMQGFLNWLLMGDAGAAYLESGAKEQAERLLISARQAHVRAREEAQSEMDQLRAELSELKRQIKADKGESKNAK